MTRIETFQLLALGFLLWVLVTIPTFAAVLDLGKSSSRVEFLAVGNPSSLKIKGELKGENSLSGKIEKLANKFRIEAVVQLKNLSTGISLRDSHMKDKYLKVNEHPEARILINELSLPSSAGVHKATFSGELSLHGKTQPVTGTVNANLGEKDGEFLFKFATPIAPFGIEIPSYLGITVANNVDIEVEIEGEFN